MARGSRGRLPPLLAAAAIAGGCGLRENVAPAEQGVLAPGPAPTTFSPSLSVAAATPPRPAPPAPSAAPHPAPLADLDPSNDREVGPPPPLAGCGERLAAAGVSFDEASLPATPARGRTPACGAEQVVTYRRGPRAIRYSAPPLLTCGMALALARFEEIAHEEATRALGATVTRVEQSGTYSCRTMARFRRLASEHSFANAIDVHRFVLDDGRVVSVREHFGPTGGEAATPEALFLRRLARRLYDEGVFSCVLTPFFDRLHHDHFHLDLARYRVDGTR